MNYVTLDEIKVHLRLDDIQSEDTYLDHIGQTAESLAIATTQMSNDELESLSDERLEQFKSLILCIVTDLYEKRGLSESQQSHVSPVAQILAKSLRSLTHNSEN